MCSQHSIFFCHILDICLCTHCHIGCHQMIRYQHDLWGLRPYSSLGRFAKILCTHGTNKIYNVVITSAPIVQYVVPIVFSKPLNFISFEIHDEALFLTKSNVLTNFCHLLDKQQWIGNTIALCVDWFHVSRFNTHDNFFISALGNWIFCCDGRNAPNL